MLDALVAGGIGQHAVRRGQAGDRCDEDLVWIRTAPIARPTTIENRSCERAPLVTLIDEPSSVDPLRRRMIAVAYRAPNK
jgi:hypothetical protein